MADNSEQAPPKKQKVDVPPSPKPAAAPAPAPAAAPAPAPAAPKPAAPAKPPVDLWVCCNNCDRWRIVDELPAEDEEWECEDHGRDCSEPDDVAIPTA